MWEIITENKKISWLVLVLLFTLLFRFLLNLFFKFVLKQDEKRKSDYSSFIKMLKRISIIFLYVFAMFLASYALFEKAVYETISANIHRSIWIAMVATITVIGAALSQRYFTKKIDNSAKRDKQDPTAYKFLNYFATFFIYFTGICLAALAIPVLKGIAQTALTGAGALAVVAGIASQEGLANLVGGLLVVFFKPFRIGDFVRIGPDILGKVEDLTLRHTVIKDFHNKRVVIPNSIINKEKLINYNLGEKKICEWIEIDISYDSDIDKAIELMRNEAMNHPSCIDNRTHHEKETHVPKVVVSVVGLKDSSVKLRAWVWAKDYQIGVAMRHDLFKSIKERFDSEGIKIPFPHQSLVFENALKISKSETVKQPFSN